MLPIARLFSSLAITLCFVSITALAQSSKDEQANQSTVSGRVTLGDKPVRGFVVGLLPHNRPGPSQPDQTPRAKTDAEGNYRITGAAAGNYRLAPLSSAYVMNTANGYGLQGIPVTLGENEHLENINIQLATGGVITGRVTDQNGKPVIEANISIEPGGDQGFRPPAIPRRVWNTDDRGIYRIFGLPEGKYKIAVHRYSPNAISTRVYYPGTADQAQAKIVEVASGSETTDIDIKISNSESRLEISGRVVDDTGNAVSNASLEYRFMESNRGWFGSSVRVNTDGTFRLSGLTPGTYVLIARENSQFNANWYGEPLKLELQSGDLKGVEVKVQRGVSISGSVIVEGISDISKIPSFSHYRIASSTRPVEREMSYSPKTATIEAGGAFRINGVAPGQVQLMLSVINLPESAIKLIRVEHNGQDVTRGFEVGANENVAGVRVICAYGTGVIKGQVQIQGGTLPDGTILNVICLRPNDSPDAAVGHGQVDARGRFVIERLPEGNYVLMVGVLWKSGSRPPRLPFVRQPVRVINGAEVPATLVVNLSPNN